jgi:hypothetical protein
MESAFLGLQDQYESSMMKKKALEEELEDLEGKLLRAEKLLSGTCPSTFLTPIQSVAQGSVILLLLLGQNTCPESTLMLVHGPAV